MARKNWSGSRRSTRAKVLLSFCSPRSTRNAPTPHMFVSLFHHGPSYMPVGYRMLTWLLSYRSGCKFLRFRGHVLRGGKYMGKTGTIWQFFRALFPSTWRTLSPDALLTRIWDTRKHPESATFSCSLLVFRSTLPRNAYFSWQTLNCQIVPFLPSYRGGRRSGERGEL